MPLGSMTWPGLFKYALMERNTISSSATGQMLEVLGSWVLKEIFRGDHRSSTLRMQVFERPKAIPQQSCRDPESLANVQHVHIGDNCKGDQLTYYSPLFLTLHPLTEPPEQPFELRIPKECLASKERTSGDRSAPTVVV